jgi:hypothetical protein
MSAREKRRRRKKPKRKEAHRAYLVSPFEFIGTERQGLDSPRV